MSNYIKSLLLQGTNDVGKALQGPKLSLDNSTWKTLNDMFHNSTNMCFALYDCHCLALVSHEFPY